MPLLFNATAVETQIKLRPNTGSFRRPIKDWYLGTIELFPVCPRWTAWTLDILTGNGNWWFWAEQDTRVKNSSDIRFASDSQTHGVYYSRAFLGKFPLSNWVADMTGMQRKDHSVGCSFPSHRRCFLRREAQTWWACVFGRIRLCLGVPGKIKETERERERELRALLTGPPVLSVCVCVCGRVRCVFVAGCVCVHMQTCVTTSGSRTLYGMIQWVRRCRNSISAPLNCTFTLVFPQKRVKPASHMTSPGSHGSTGESVGKKNQEQESFVSLDSSTETPGSFSWVSVRIAISPPTFQWSKLSTFVL